jgi:endonuclease I
MYRFTAILLAAITAAVAPGADAQQTKHSTYRAANAAYWDEIYPPAASGAPDYSELYCERKFRRKNDSLDLEHAYPAGWMAGARQCGSRRDCQSSDEGFGYIEADFHNLFPAYDVANRERSSNLFGPLGDDAPRPITNCPLKVDKIANIAEPRKIVRGNLARAIFYIAYTYDLPVDRAMLPHLIEWHRADPVTRDERRIHDRMSRVQETTNGFVTGELDPTKVRFKVCDAVFTGQTVSWEKCREERHRGR